MGVRPSIPPAMLPALLTAHTSTSRMPAPRAGRTRAPTAAISAIAFHDYLTATPLGLFGFSIDQWTTLALVVSAGLSVTLIALFLGRRKASKTISGSEGKMDSEDLRAFLRMDAEEKFDLEALNAMDLKSLAREVLGRKRLLRAVMRQVDALLPRVRSETEDPTFAGIILRNKTLDWFRRSPSDPDWTEKMVRRWSGIFHESRIPGGRLSLKLSVRLVRLRMECAEASGFVGVLLFMASGLRSIRGRLNAKSFRNLMISVKTFRTDTKRPSERPLPQVCQAYLDDLAARPRPRDRPLGLERLSELARRISLPEVNRTLGEVFPREGAGPAVVLDSSFHSDIQDMMVQAPSSKAGGHSLLFELASTGPSASSGAAPDDATNGTNLGSPWERTEITREEWRQVLEALQRRKGRLDPPPIENYRNHGSYLALRELILADTSSCKAFLAVRWKGKPSGISLLAQLLSEGTYLPEAETDADYLEAELGHLENGNPDSRPKDGRWNLSQGRIVVREIAEGNVRAYRSERGVLDSRNAVARTS